MRAAKYLIMLLGTSEGMLMHTISELGVSDWAIKAFLSY